MNGNLPMMQRIWNDSGQWIVLASKVKFAGPKEGELDAIDFA